MARVEEIGDKDGWRCWLCDEPVDPDMSVNDPRGPSVDAVVTKAKAKKAGPAEERLAHRACNTKKGAITPVVPWAGHLFVVDPAPIVPTVERLQRKGGREVVARCPTREDADDAATWRLDRLGRRAPGLEVAASVDQGGGQFVVALTAR
jgi:hypothetical protein